MIEAKQLQKCSSVKLAAPRTMIFVFALDDKTAGFRLTCFLNNETATIRSFSFKKLPLFTGYL